MDNNLRTKCFKLFLHNFFCATPKSGFIPVQLHDLEHGLVSFMEPDHDQLVLSHCNLVFCTSYNLLSGLIW